MSLPEAPRTHRQSRIPIAPASPQSPSLLPLHRPHLGTPGAPLANRPTGALLDALGRPLTDLRISVTDRCNFRCGYCMPRSVFGPDHRFLPQPDILRFEEIVRVARVLVQLGVRKIRLTGGEPLLRKDLSTLVAQLATLRAPDGLPVDLALTTNGTLLSRQAEALRAAGLNRVTVSLDALDDALMQQMSDARLPVADVLAGIDAAQAAGLGPVKVNMVVQRGVNDHQILPMARHFRHRNVALRFIEFMDVGHTNAWQMDQVLPSAEVLRLLQTEFPLRPLAPDAPGDTAQRWAHADGAGEVGFISSVTQAFCGHCSRLRLSTDGRLFSCLFASRGHDLRTALRASQPWRDEELARSLAMVWHQRQDRYSQLRAQPSPGAPTDAQQPRIEMSYIGG